MSLSSYILSKSTVPVAPKLTLTQFIQTVFVGITGIPGTLVRPKWQVEPPEQPDLTVDWMALGIEVLTPDANGYLWPDTNGAVQYQRHELLEVTCAIYGPAAIGTYSLIRDGFQIPQNLYALRAANMGFVEVGPGRHIPDLVHQRFINRIQTSVYLRREVQRVYPIPTLIAANGVIYTDTFIDSDQYSLDWKVQT